MPVPLSTYEEVPVEEYPVEEAPVEAVPVEAAPVEGGGVPLDTYDTVEPAAAPAEPPPEQAAPGPFAGAVQAVGDTLGQAGEAVLSAVPAPIQEPVRNVANAVGQPIGGIVDTVTGVTQELGQGDIPGAVGAGLGGLSGPWERGVEQTGERIAQGEAAVPTPPEILADPGQALAVLPGLASRYGPAPALSGVTQEEWARQNPERAADAYAQGGGPGMHDAWLADTLGQGDVPPPQLSNPFDTATSGDPMQRLGQVAGAIPAFASGWVESQKQGTLAPFLIGQAQSITEDPLTLLDAVGVFRGVAPRTGALTRRLVDAAPEPVRKLTELSDTEQARLTGERLASGGEEYLQAAARQGGDTLAPPQPLATTAPQPLTTPAGTSAAPPPTAVPSPVPGAVTPPLVTPPSGAAASPPLATPIPNVAPASLAAPPPPAFTVVESPVRGNFRLHTVLDANGQPVRSFRDPAAALQYVLDLQTQHAAANAAIGSAPPGYRQAVTQAMPASPAVNTRGIVVADKTEQLLRAPLEAKVRFRDGSKPSPNTPAADVIDQMRLEFDTWLGGFDARGTPLPWTKTSRSWARLNEKFAVNGVDVRTLGPDLRNPIADTPQARARADFLAGVWTDAIERGLEQGEKRNGLLATYDQYTNTLRQAMLFNWLNAPRYALQNLITNTVNIQRRGGGILPALSVWTDLAEWGRAFRHLKDPNSAMMVDSLLKTMGVGDYPNLRMTQKAFFDQTPRPHPRTGTLPKITNAAGKLIAPESVKVIASVPDILGRVQVAEAAITKGFRKLNENMVDRIVPELDRRALGVPRAKVQQVWKEFQEESRYRIDPNTGTPYTNWRGVPAKYEPVWNPDDLAKRLSERLRQDMLHKPDPDRFANAIERIRRDAKNEVRRIADDADAQTDSALFDWRNRNGDELLARAVLFHFWMSRQGGLYVTEALRHPWIASAYGRMMEDLEQQAEAIGAPVYMTGFFQLQRSVGGMSTWYSPFDLVQSILTMADWQMQGDADGFRDLTWLGKAASVIPFFVHPAIELVGYELGLLGSDYPAPRPLGVETFGAKAIDLLNLANVQDAPFMQPFNAMGIGVDADGNKVAIPTKPLEQLYASVGNFLSSAMRPITGLTPVNVVPPTATVDRNIVTVIEQNIRKANPDMGESEVIRLRDAYAEDHGSDEYQTALREVMTSKYELGEGMNPVVAGIGRIVSPISVTSMPEQRALDTMKGLQPSGNLPERNFSEDPAVAERELAAAKYGPSSTPEGRQLTALDTEYRQLVPSSVKKAGQIANAISKCTAEGCYLGDVIDGDTVTIGGQEYTPDQVADLDKDTRKILREQSLLDAGVTQEEIDAGYRAEQQYLAEHPNYAGFQAYKDLVGAYGQEDADLVRFVQDTARINPGFAQYANAKMTNHETGQLDPEKVKKLVWVSDAYLASQGVRPSVYTSLAGNDPNTIPGGYPRLPGVTEGQPPLPLYVSATENVPIWEGPTDFKYPNYNTPVGEVAPGFPALQAIGVPDQNGMVLVATPGREVVGYADFKLLTNASPPGPTGAPPVQPAGGGLAGAVRSVVDAVGGGITNLTGHNSGTPVKPASTSTTPGYTDLVPATDGLGVQSTIASDRTWMEDMMDGHAAVTTDYKQPVTWEVDYSYQIGHGADDTTHAAYDISCDTGNCVGTPIKAPLAGTVTCAGYGQGESTMPGATCNYSAATTLPGQAHTIVLDVGTDPQGNSIQLSFNHMGTSNVQPGQQITPGTLLGGMGDTDAGPHVHLEGWGLCPATGTYQILDPQLIVSGYYQQNAVC
jgi:murein DD-endopeptidase MepM/ murein hydrolase activator NlpD